MGMSRRRRGREGSRAEDHLGPRLLSSRTWLQPLGSPSAQLGGWAEGEEERGEGGGLPSPSPDPSPPGMGSVWLLLKAGNKGPN